MPPAKMSAPWEPPDTMGDEEQEAEPATSSQLLPLLFGGTPRKAQTLVDWVEARKAAEREKFQPWGEIITRISAKEFATQGALALAYGKPAKWATTLKKVAMQHGVFTGETWRACFIGVRGNGSQYDPSITSARGPGGGSPALTRAQFEAVFLQKQACLTFNFVVQLMRLRCWGSVVAFARHFRQRPAWSRAFRTLLIRERTMTAQQWSACFGG